LHNDDEEEEENDSDDDDDGQDDDQCGMSKEELVDLQASLEPIWLMLTKVS
jgi:hypothetical protein